MRLFLLLAAFAVSLPVAAEDASWYAGAGLGAYTIEVDDVDVEIEDLAFTAYGGWQFMPHLAGELAYTRLFEGDDNFFGTKIEAETDILALTVNPTLPIGENFSLFGKLGWAYVSMDVSGLGQTETEDDDELTYGVGGEYKVARWGIRGEVNALDVSGGDMYSYTIGVKYGF